MLMHKLLVIFLLSARFCLLADEYQLTDFRPNALIGVGACSNKTYLSSFKVEVEWPTDVELPVGVISNWCMTALGVDCPDGDVRLAVAKDRQWFDGFCRDEIVKAFADRDEYDYYRERVIHEVKTKTLLKNRRFWSSQISSLTTCGIPCGVANDPQIINCCYDLKAGKRITVDDLVEAKNRRNVLNIIRLCLYESHNDADEFKKFAKPETITDAELAAINEGVGKGDVGAPTVTDNFLLSKEGIVWTYNAGEAVSYGWGMITVTVPWAKMSGLLKESLIN